MNLQSRIRQRGATLPETMIAMLILGVGMLAYISMHASSLQVGKMAQYRSVAAQLANDYSARMRANAEFAGTGGYVFQQAYQPLGANLADPGCALPVCTAAEIAARDLATWRNTARNALPGGSFYTEIDLAVPVINGFVQDMWVLWQDPDSGDDGQIGIECPPEVGAPPALRCMHFRITL